MDALKIAQTALAAAGFGSDPEPCTRALGVLNRAGVRLLSIDGETVVGIWSDLDSPRIRGALEACGFKGRPIRYLDGADIPARYKLRRAAGEPVPMNVLAAMERRPEKPWKIRDQMLKSQHKSERSE